VVLDLGVGQRGLLGDRPEHRPGTGVEPAVQQELAQLAGDLRLGREGHGGVGPLPVADHAQALELLGLHADPVGREVAALAAELDRRHRVLVLALGPVALFDLPFDRQAVAVPAGDVVGIPAQHLLRAGDHVLEDLVERVAHVQVAVRVGRAVVQDELLAAPGGLAQQAEQPELLPARQDLRLALGQAGAHREVALRQEYGGSVVDGHGTRCSRIGQTGKDERAPEGQGASLRIRSAIPRRCSVHMAPDISGRVRGGQARGRGAASGVPEGRSVLVTGRSAQRDRRESPRPAPVRARPR